MTIVQPGDQGCPFFAGAVAGQFVIMQGKCEPRPEVRPKLLVGHHPCSAFWSAHVRSCRPPTWCLFAAEEESCSTPLLGPIEVTDDRWMFRSIEALGSSSGGGLLAFPLFVEEVSWGGLREGK